MNYKARRTKPGAHFQPRPNSKTSKTASANFKDYSQLLELPDAPFVLKARALLNQGIAKNDQHDYPGAIEDFTKVIELQGATVEQKTNALLNRGIAKKGQHDYPGAVEDFTKVVELEGATVEQKVRALLNRGAIEDYKPTA